VRRSTPPELVNIMVLAANRDADRHIAGVEDDEESGGRIKAPN
jgi:hypothetical protein